ncbi:MAG: hypothetical protein MK209_05675 [Planctomycetes bacterium]|nr:hypothetical protein [Planctomycetota bacterium]
MLLRWVVGCGLMFGLVACATNSNAFDAASTAAALAPPAPVCIELPLSAESWRGALETDARELEQLLDQVLARWPRQSDAGELRLVLLPSPRYAKLWAEQNGLPGDGRVPRTHLQARLAVVPMAREDRLMTQRQLPPRTLRETVRHEMAHLFMLDREGLQDAPHWFHEGLAEAWVGLREIDGVSPRSHVLGACWQAELQAQFAAESVTAYEAVDVLTAIAGMPAELRYTAWAELVLHLMREDTGQRPWELASARPSLASFLSRGPEVVAHPLIPGLPRPLGREVDFIEGGRSVLLAAADGETVGLQARSWYGIEALRLRARVGLTGEPSAELLLGPPGSEKCLRVRINGFGAIVAAYESREQPLMRAQYDRLPDGALQRWRDLEIRLIRRAEIGTFDDAGNVDFSLLVHSGGYRVVLPIPTIEVARPGAPWLLEFRVRSGAFEVIGDAPLVADLQ